VLYSTIIYWSTGLHPSVDRYFIFVGILLLTTTNATALGYFVSSISPNAAIANAIGPPVFIILLLYGNAIYNDKFITAIANNGDMIRWILYQCFFITCGKCMGTQSIFSLLGFSGITLYYFIANDNDLICITNNRH